MNLLSFAHLHPTSGPRGLGAPLRRTLLVILLMLGPTLAHAQNFERIEERASNVPSYFYHVLPGNATMKVEVLGAVRSPGLYVLDATTTLNELLALSGGPLLDARTSASSRTIIVRLMQSQQGNSPPTFEARLPGAITYFEDAPALADGDILNVEIVERRRFTWRDVFTVANTVALIVLSIERLSNI